MTKVYRLTDVDCPVCAGKMQDLIEKIDGVKSARIDFLAQKLTIEADEASLASVLKAAKKAVRKIEPDCEIEEW